jgi:hypothetical protein
MTVFRNRYYSAFGSLLFHRALDVGRVDQYRDFPVLVRETNRAIL